MKYNLETDRQPSFSNGVVPVLPFKRILYRWRGGSSSRHSTYYDAECFEFKPQIWRQHFEWCQNKSFAVWFTNCCPDSYVFEKSLDTILFRREIDIWSIFSPEIDEHIFSTGKFFKWICYVNNFITYMKATVKTLSLITIDLNEYYTVRKVVKLHSEKLIYVCVHD